ncbi:hypothetical protein LTR36_000481 [Oleoguttula mirabilis]|uniref:Uncharacterized protein n=1 Tax=Oleoguttula mirabilis TaxID=1507867 RepID=A0AAV9JPW8_9PEZI|nr:hypothetical protein LTR36_000481 [Oleoguttula mirabilis]
MVIVETVYFGTVYIAATKAVQADEMPTKSVQVEQWGACLILSGGKKDECLEYAKVLGLSERLVTASFFMSALIGLFTFALMVRWSMLVGWHDTTNWFDDELYEEEERSGARRNGRGDV